MGRVGSRLPQARGGGRGGVGWGSDRSAALVGWRNQKPEHAGGKPARRGALNQSRLAPHPREGLDILAEREPPFSGLPDKGKGRPQRKVRWAVGQVGQSKFLLECQCFKQGGVFEWGRLHLSLKMLWHQDCRIGSPSVNKAVQRLFRGGMALKRSCSCTDLYYYFYFILTATKHFCCVSLRIRLYRFLLQVQILGGISDFHSCLNYKSNL